MLWSWLWQQVKQIKVTQLIDFIFNVWILDFCYKKVLQRVSNKRNIQHNEILKSYYSSEKSEFQSFKISYFTSKIWNMGYIVLFLDNQIRDISRANDKYIKFHCYFNSEWHNGMEDWKITIIDRAENVLRLRRRERYWQHRLDAFITDGLNERFVGIPIL